MSLLRTGSHRWIRARRGIVAVAAVTAVFTALAGCGDDGDSSTTTESTRTIQTDKGAVKVPTKPKRIVSLLYSTALLLDLGVKPVGTLEEYDGDYPASEWAEVQKIAVVGASETEINYEKLASLNPDLIVSTQRRAEDFGYAKLTKIAPTAFFVAETPAEVQAVLPKLADAVGKSDEVSDRTAEYKKKAGTIKTEHAAILAKDTFAYVEGGPEGFVANSPVSWPGLYMEEAGLKFSKAAASEREARGVRLSFEQVSSLQDATVLFYSAGPDSKPDQGTAKLLGQAAWKNLPAVKAGHVYPIQYGYQYSFKGAIQILDQIDAALGKLS